MRAPAPSAVTAGSATPVDATCLRRRRGGLLNVVLFRMHADGPRRVGELTFRACHAGPEPADDHDGGSPAHR